MPAPGPVKFVLPVEPRAYHEFYRSPGLRWWKPLVALVAAAAAAAIAMVVLQMVFFLVSLASGSVTISQVKAGNVSATPLLFLGNNLGLVALIGVALAANRLFFRQPVGWFVSIQGRFRWRLLGRFLLIALPFFLLMMGLHIAIRGFPALKIDANTVPMILIVLLTTPLQCAGEEFATRGLVARCIGAWFSHETLGWVVSTAVSTAIFMVLHVSSDPWLNLFYVCFGVVASLLVWRTGGLEAAIAIHYVNNMAGLVWTPFTDMTGIFNRQAGTGSAFDLIQLACLLLAAGAILWQAKRMKLPVQAAPGRRPVTSTTFCSSAATPTTST